MAFDKFVLKLIRPALELALDKIDDQFVERATANFIAFPIKTPIAGLLMLNIPQGPQTGAGTTKIIMRAVRPSTALGFCERVAKNSKPTRAEQLVAAALKEGLAAYETEQPHAANRSRILYRLTRPKRLPEAVANLVQQAHLSNQ